LAREGVTSSTTRHSPDGLILEKRVNTGALESFRAGMFEMQDEASQLVSLLVNPVPGTTVVDACAGAGGKSLHLAALMRGEGTVHAFDSDAVRLRSLSTRASRAGAGNIHTAAIEVSAPVDESLTGAADVLLIDAPCSGVGTYRRNPGAKSGFSVGYSAALGELQDSLLQRYHRVVRPGGRLVYATCTLLRRENEGVIERFLGEHPEYRLIPASSVVGSLGVPTAYDPFLFLLPHETGTDGFFGAVLERVAVSS
jgi:16S rRNA (cytosine967-C5)-methyltransferase